MAEVERQISTDGSRKYRFLLESSLSVEAAFFEVPGRERPLIACISTQVGCAVGCPFCNAARNGLLRNLRSDEIIQEIEWILADANISKERLRQFEVSFMGMGEPLANLRELLSALATLNQQYPEISRVSVSTAGPSRRIDALIAALPVRPPIHLQISLHATTNALRKRLVPNSPDSIENLLEAGKRYHQVTGDHVCLNYVLLKGRNDSPEDICRLAEIDRESFYIKLTALNTIPDMPRELIAPSNDELLAFSNSLRLRGVPHKVFVGDGLDVLASCGQLAATPRTLGDFQAKSMAES